MIKYTAILLLFSVLCTACTHGGPSEGAQAGSAIQLKYATLLRISENAAGERTACIISPWDTTKVLSAFTIGKPISRALITTSLHAHLFVALGAAGSIAGVCDAQYMMDTAIAARVRAREILSCGSSQSPSRELILGLAPDAVFVSPLEGADYAFYSENGIDVIQCVDYLEPTPLGQAEWMRFYGMLVGRERQADSIFAMVERNYLNVRDSALGAEVHPTLMAELLQGQAWYTPTGRSTTGALYQDAGADYIFKNLDSDRAVAPLSLEQVFAQAHGADFWIFKYYSPSDFTYESLAGDCDLYADFKAFKDRNIWACNSSRVPYFDIVPFRPDLLLRDIAAMLHPELWPGYDTRFFGRLKQASRP